MLTAGLWRGYIQKWREMGRLTREDQEKLSAVGKIFSQNASSIVQLLDFRQFLKLNPEVLPKEGENL